MDLKKEQKVTTGEGSIPHKGVLPPIDQETRVGISVVLGTIAGLLVSVLGLSKFVILVVGTAVAGITLAVIKYIDQNPTST